MYVPRAQARAEVRVIDGRSRADVGVVGEVHAEDIPRRTERAPPGGRSAAFPLAMLNCPMYGLVYTHSPGPVLLVPKQPDAPFTPDNCMVPVPVCADNEPATSASPAAASASDLTLPTLTPAVGCDATIRPTETHNTLRTNVEHALCHCCRPHRLQSLPRGSIAQASVSQSLAVPRACADRLFS